MIDLHWAAGFFEGEGYIGISTAAARNNQRWLLVEVSQVDPQPLRLLHARWGGRLHLQTTRKANQRSAWRWCLCAEQAARFLADIRPYCVRDLVRERIAIAIQFQDGKTHTHKNRTDAYKTQEQFLAGQLRTLNARGIAPESPYAVAGIS